MPTLDITYGAATDQGPRPTQQDTYAVFDGQDGFAAALVDGYGTHPDTGHAVDLAARVAAYKATQRGARRGLIAGGHVLARPDVEIAFPDGVGVVLCHRDGRWEAPTSATPASTPGTPTRTVTAAWCSRPWTTPAPRPPSTAASTRTNSSATWTPGS